MNGKRIKEILSTFWICVVDESLRKYIFEPPVKGTGYITAVFCRAASHPAGMTWYSNGMEPDYTCKGCGDNCG